MNTPTYNQILNNLVLISIQSSIWSASKKLRPEDLGGANLPPEKLASLGTKRVFDPTAIKVFHTLKRKAERLCEAEGTRFLDCFAVPKDRASALVEGLEEIRKEFEEAKEEFLKEYDQVLEQWLADTGEWRGVIANAVETADAVRSKLRFSVAVYAIGIPEEVETAAPLMEKQVGGLSGQLIREIGQAAKASWEDSFRGKTEVTRKALRPLKGILDKLRGLLFIDPVKFAGLVNNIDAALNATPKTGPITGAVLMGLVGALHECADLAGFVSAKEAAEMMPPSVDPEPECDNEDTADAEQPTKAGKVKAKAKANAKPVEPAAVWFW